MELFKSGALGTALHVHMFLFFKIGFSEKYPFYIQFSFSHTLLFRTAWTFFWVILFIVCVCEIKAHSCDRLAQLLHKKYNMFFYDLRISNLKNF